MRGRKLVRVALIVPLALILSAPGVSRGAPSPAHVVAFESIDTPGFTFHSVNFVGVATLSPFGVTDPLLLWCIHFTTFDTTHVLVQASAKGSDGRLWFFTFYGTGLIRGKATPLPDYSAPCWASANYYGDQGVGVIL